MAAPAPQLRIGRTTLPASDSAGIAAAIEAWNSQSAIADVPAAFNPQTIDPAKAAALLAALAHAPDDVLAGRTLILDATSLRIGTSSPTTPDSFAGALHLEIDSEHGPAVIARAVVPTDCDLARARAAAAKTLAAEADRKVAAATGDAAVPARRQRQAITRAWFDNAAALAGCVPNDATAQADRAEAEAAMKAAIVIGGMIQ
jgi:hypothetical protein